MEKRYFYQNAISSAAYKHVTEMEVLENCCRIISDKMVLIKDVPAGAQYISGGYTELFRGGQCVPLKLPVIRP